MGESCQGELTPGDPTSEHDWARIEGDEGRPRHHLWYAQDALGGVVFFDPPATGTAVSASESYAEVEPVKAV